MPKTEQQTFNMMEWLRGYLHATGQDARSVCDIPDNLPSFLYFVLLWNMFEALLPVGKNPDFVTKMEGLLPDNAAGFSEQTKLLAHLKYFQDRYVNAANNTVHQKLFDRLSFRKMDRKDFVKKVLKGEVQTLPEITLALMIIVYRLRNNLFHGLKNISHLDLQETNFDVANRVLADVLDLLNPMQNRAPGQ